MADDSRMAEDAREVERLKRRLRKKLRQIENLELLERELNWEELDKVKKDQKRPKKIRSSYMSINIMIQVRRKVEIREQLALLVQDTEEDEVEQ